MPDWWSTRRITDWWRQAYLPKLNKNGPMSTLGTKCWLWNGNHNVSNKRPMCKMPGTRKNVLVYRMVVIYRDGPISAGLEVDHLCNNILCIRYSHLEVVTRHINQIRYGNLTTHCPRGHEYNDANTRILTYGNGRRACRVCHRLRERKRRAARKRIVK